MSLAERLEKALGPQGVIADAAGMARYLTDWKRSVTGEALCVARPASTGEVAKVVRLAAEAGVPIVPQGGNTGLSAGAVPLPAGRQLLLSLERMRAIRACDPVGLVLEAEAGCVLQTAQERAKAEGCLLPISFAAEGSATVGGVVSTNAGGVNVLRYGMTRAQVLGLEVVLADGQIVRGLRRLRKNNAGYDWKQLFIGAEGTLGVVTAAVLRLVPLPRHQVTSLLAVESPAAALELLALAQREIGDQISMFELMSPTSVELLATELGRAAPIEAGGGWLVLTEFASSLPGLAEAAEAVLAAALEQGIAHDAVLAQSEAQRAALWSLREHLPEAELRAGPSAKHDVSVPVSAAPAFLAAADRALAGEPSPPRVNAFGHLGDGNIHYNVLLGQAHDVGRINRLVHDVVTAMGGSISAEHGLGQYRVAEWARVAPPEEVALARSVKRQVDPQGRFNPGKIFGD